jgi:hypothetical protein
VEFLHEASPGGFRKGWVQGLQWRAQVLTLLLAEGPPEQLQVKDEAGRLPLHWAAQSSRCRHLLRVTRVIICRE